MVQIFRILFSEFSNLFWIWITFDSVIICNFEIDVNVSFCHNTENRLVRQVFDLNAYRLKANVGALFFLIAPKLKFWTFSKSLLFVCCLNFFNWKRLIKILLFCDWHANFKDDNLTVTVEVLEIITFRKLHTKVDVSYEFKNGKEKLLTWVNLFVKELI